MPRVNASNESTERLETVRGMIASPWGEDHFDLGVEQRGDLHGAFKRQETGCGAAGCVAGLLPLINERMSFVPPNNDTKRVSFLVDGSRIGGYLDAAVHTEGFGLSHDDASYICSPLFYKHGWTRAKVLARIDEVLDRIRAQSGQDLPKES